MKQEVFEKEQRKYVAPWCEVIQVESTGFLCGVSVGLKRYCPKKCVTIISHIFHFVQNYLLSFQHLH